MIGQKFGMLTVMDKYKRTYKVKVCRALWRCICDCGKEVITSTKNLRRSRGQISCGCARANNFKDLSGKRFGKLYVIPNSSISARHTKRRHKPTIWKCLCDCGKEHNVRAQHLISGAITNCGCEQEELRIKNCPPINHLYVSYRRGAEVRGFDFELTKEQFRALILDNCIYCGIAPNRKQIYKRPKCDDYVVLVNSIDRVDNSKGYIINNCVTACNSCNRAKLTRTVAEFAEWIERTYNHLKESKWQEHLV